MVLTGAHNDGTAGLRGSKRRGGVTVVQDPDEALVSGMPESALEYADHCLPLEKIAPLLVRLSRKTGGGKGRGDRQPARSWHRYSRTGPGE